MKQILFIIKWPLLVFVLHLLAAASGGYAYIPKLDNLFHFCGGMSIAAAAGSGLEYAKKQNWMGHSRPFVLIVITTGLVALAAVGWEFFEFSIDHVVGTHMQGNLVDTLSDLALGLCGGLLIASTQLLRRK